METKKPKPNSDHASPDANASWTKKATINNPHSVAQIMHSQRKTGSLQAEALIGLSFKGSEGKGKGEGEGAKAPTPSTAYLTNSSFSAPRKKRLCLASSIVRGV